MSAPKVLSPVDYDAWQRGYLPPSEHILIDELHRGTAKVVFRSECSPGRAIAVVSINDALQMDADDAIAFLEWFIARRRKAVGRVPYPPKMTDGDLFVSPSPTASAGDGR